MKTFVGADPGSFTVKVGAETYVNLSPATIVLVPLGVVTLISTVLADRAGEVTVMVLSLVTCRPVPEVVPNLTAVAPVNPEPVMVTAVPPAAVPLAGEMLVTLGGLDVTKM